MSLGTRGATGRRGLADEILFYITDQTDTERHSSSIAQGVRQKGPRSTVLLYFHASKDGAG